MRAMASASHPVLPLPPGASSKNFIRKFQPAGRVLQYDFAVRNRQSIKQQQALGALLRRQRLLRVVA